jgi:hypothetical protein
VRRISAGRLDDTLTRGSGSRHHAAASRNFPAAKYRLWLGSTHFNNYIELALQAHVLTHMRDVDASHITLESAGLFAHHLPIFACVRIRAPLPKHPLNADSTHTQRTPSAHAPTGPEVAAGLSGAHRARLYPKGAQSSPAGAVHLPGDHSSSMVALV